MSSIEQYQSGAVAPQDHQGEAYGRLAEWATSAQAAMQVAEQLSQSSFVPDSFRGKPGEATAAILAGLEVGLQPMAALRSFDVIQGQAAARAVTLRAIVQSHGHEIELIESTATRCRMRGRRRGSDAWQEVSWTMDRAQQLGLTGKNNWKRQPQAMLVARATSELARLIASDAILGLAYSSEEIADGAGAGVEVPEVTTADPDVPGAPTAAPGRKRMSRKKTAVKKRAAKKKAAPVEDVVDAEVIDDGGGRDVQAAIDGLSEADRADLAGWWKARGFPSLSSGELTGEQTAEILAAIDGYGRDGTGAADGRNRKMWALVAEAWPDLDEEGRDKKRRGLIALVSGGRTESSKDLADAEWDELFDSLDLVVGGSMHLHLRSNGEYELRKGDRK